MDQCYSVAVLHRCGNLSEPVLCEIVLTKSLPILMYGVECFSLLIEQKRKLCVASCPGILPGVKLLYILDQNHVTYTARREAFFIIIVLFGKYL